MNKTHLLLGLLIAVALGGGYALLGGSNDDNKKAVTSSGNIETVSESHEISKDLICKTFEEVFPEGYHKQDPHDYPFQEGKNLSYRSGSCNVEYNDRIQDSDEYAFEAKVRVGLVHETGESAGRCYFILKFVQDENEQWVLQK